VREVTLIETVRLCKMVRAAAPAQKFEEETPDLWHPVLAEFSYQECQDALVIVAREQPFIAPSDLVKVIRQHRRAGARARRAEIEADPGLVPDASPDDPAAYVAALRFGRMTDGGRRGIEPKPDSVKALIAGLWPLKREA
jgi:hypothetical protein